MRTQNRNWMPGLVAALGAVLLVVPGCATKKYVNDGLSAEDARISDVESQVESNQRELRDTGRKLDGVARDAREAGDASRQAGQRADEAYDLAKGKLLHKVVLNDVSGHFKVNNAELDEASRKHLEGLADRLKAENASVYLEIAGHTDSSGPEAYNMTLALRRAEAVRRYLNSEHGIPLHRMSVISYGESQPVADNGNKDGRAQNRRVEVSVLS